MIGCGSIVHQDDSQDNKAAGPILALKPQFNRKLSDIHCYKGTVSAADVNWFELAVGWVQPDAEIWNWERTVLLRRREYDNSKPKRISALNTRPGGDHDCEPFLPAGVPEMTHRASDLQVGDFISFTLAVTHEGEEWPLQLTIHRRPGGTIPPMHGDPHAGTLDAFHLSFQAEQDWEEKRIPIPKRYLDKDGYYHHNRDINPPYRLLPVAPPPRAVIPAAKP